MSLLSRQSLLGAALLAFAGALPLHGADAEIVKRLERIEVLRQAEAELQRQLADEGKSDEGLAKIALCRARIDLARELGQQADVITQLQQILRICQARLQRAREMVAANITSSQGLPKMEIEVLQVEIEIRREQMAVK
ncbi:MAG: hypothetical protein ACO1TE_16335 [Prosthecobacter sp.]